MPLCLDCRDSEPWSTDPHTLAVGAPALIGLTEDLRAFIGCSGRDLNVGGRHLTTTGVSLGDRARLERSMSP
jgi:hypothetical protein